MRLIVCHTRFLTYQALLVRIIVGVLGKTTRVKTHGGSSLVRESRKEQTPTFFHALIQLIIISRTGRHI